MWKLIRFFLIEEIRLRRSFSSSLSLIIFPEILFMGALSGYVFLSFLEGTLTIRQIHTAVIGSLFLFGVSMGGIAFLGKDFIERSLGPVTMLAASVSYHPVDQKKMYLAYYLHDIIFYVILILGPVTGGLLIGLIERPMALDRLLLITASQWSAFFLGLSLSMLVSSLLNNGNRKLLLIVPFSITPLVAVQLFTGDARSFVPVLEGIKDGSPWWILLTLALSAAYAAVGTATFDPSVSSVRKQPPGSYSRTYRFSSLIYPRDEVSRSLLARELIGLVRGKAYVRIGFSLFFPLFVISGMIGLLSGVEGAPVSFNLIFFAVMISFFTISVYTHISNLDFFEFDQTIPVDTPTMIKVKVRLYLLISIPVALIFLITMALAMGDLRGLLFGIPLILVSVPYMGFVTAYLTGLWTNSLLFDSTVFMRYMVFTVLPLMFSTMLSFLMTDLFLPSAAGIVSILVIGTAATVIISRSIDKRWKDTVLSSSGRGS